MSSVTPRLERLPAELQDMVIDHLQDDNASLVSCALVCKAWLPRARLHLYTEVELTSPASRCRLLETHQTVPTARCLCKNLKFSDRPVDGYVAADILQLLPDLERLEWTNDVYDSAAPGGVGIRRFAEAISSLNSLRYLCSNGSDLDEQSPISNMPSSAPGLRSLVTLKLYTNDFNAHGPDRLNHWLCKAIADAKEEITHPQFYHLRELLFTISYDILDKVRHMRTLMSVVGPHLQTLTLAWEYIPDFPLKQKHLDNSGLVLCKSLESLAFHLIYPSVYSFKHCAAYLALVPRSAPVRHFTLSFEFYLYEAVEDPAGDSELEEQAEIALCRGNYSDGVARLDAAICDLPHLEDLTICLPKHDYGRDANALELAQWLRSRFPRVEASAKFGVRWENESSMDA